MLSCQDHLKILHDESNTDDDYNASPSVNLDAHQLQQQWRQAVLALSEATKKADQLAVQLSHFRGERLDDLDTLALHALKQQMMVACARVERKIEANERAERDLCKVIDRK